MSFSGLHRAPRGWLTEQMTRVTSPATAQSSHTGGGGIGAALAVRPFRRLWLVFGLSSLGDWLGLLATAAFASAQVTPSAAKGVAFGSVIAVQLLPAVLLGPVAGVLADRFDRRYTMVVIDVLRFVLYASIPVIVLLGRSGPLAVAWTAVILFVVQTAALLWAPAKEAAVPSLLPASLLEPANQLTLITTYGLTPVAGAVLFAGLAKLPTVAGSVTSAGIALWVDALTFLASAAVVWFGVKEISGRRTVRTPRSTGPGLLSTFISGTRFIATTPLVRGVVVGVLGAFGGAGIVIGVARFYASSLGGGDSTFAILFAVLFTGFGVGVAGGPVLVGQLSRRRWFASAIVLGGAAVLLLATAPRLSLAVIGAFIAGAAAGMAFLAGVTLIGKEIADDVRGRVFAFIQTAVRLTLLVAIAAAGALAGVGSSRELTVGGLHTNISTARALLFTAGAAGAVLGIMSGRQMDDRRGVPLLADLWNTIVRRRSAS
jgi:dTMP kinase